MIVEVPYEVVEPMIRAGLVTRTSLDGFRLGELGRRAVRAHMNGAPAARHVADFTFAVVKAAADRVR